MAQTMAQEGFHAHELPFEWLPQAVGILEHHFDCGMDVTQCFAELAAKGFACMKDQVCGWAKHEQKRQVMTAHTIATHGESTMEQSEDSSISSFHPNSEDERASTFSDELDGFETDDVALPDGNFPGNIPAASGSSTIVPVRVSRSQNVMAYNLFTRENFKGKASKFGLFSWAILHTLVYLAYLKSSQNFKISRVRRILHMQTFHLRSGQNYNTVRKLQAMWKP